MIYRAYSWLKRGTIDPITENQGKIISISNILQNRCKKEPMSYVIRCYATYSRKLDQPHMRFWAAVRKFGMAGTTRSPLCSRPEKSTARNGQDQNTMSHDWAISTKHSCVNLKILQLLYLCISSQCNSSHMKPVCNPKNHIRNETFHGIYRTGWLVKHSLFRFLRRCRLLGCSPQYLRNTHAFITF